MRSFYQRDRIKKQKHRPRTMLLPFYQTTPKQGVPFICYIETVVI